MIEVLPARPEKLAERLGEPEWLKEARAGAGTVFEALPWPDRKTEPWRYAAGRLKRIPFDLPLALPKERALSRDALPAGVRKRLADADLAGFLVFLGPDLVYAELEPELLEKGVVLTSLHRALGSHPELIEANLYKAIPARERGDANDKIPALAAALWTYGAFVYVPAGVEVKKPLAAFFVSEAEELEVSRTLILLDDHASLAYAEEHLSESEGEAVHVGMTELVLRPGARLVHANVQTKNRKSHHLYRQRALLEKDAALKDLAVNLGAGFARTEVGSELLGPGADSEMLGIYFAAGDQHHDHYTLQHHVAPHARSDVYYKGVAKDEGQIVYQGLIKLEPAAQKTDAYQTNRNLLLSKKARVESVPQLEIAANDVRCSHGSSIAPIDEEQLFYLETRGIRRKSAENLLVAAFLEDVLGRVPLENLARHVARVIEEKVRG